MSSVSGAGVGCGTGVGSRRRCDALAFAHQRDRLAEVVDGLRADKDLPIDEEGWRAADAELQTLLKISLHRSGELATLDAALDRGRVVTKLASIASEKVDSVCVARPLLLSSKQPVVHRKVSLVRTAGSLTHAAGRLSSLGSLGMNTLQREILEHQLGLA